MKSSRNTRSNSLLPRHAPPPVVGGSVVGGWVVGGWVVGGSVVVDEVCVVVVGGCVVVVVAVVAGGAVVVVVDDVVAVDVVVASAVAEVRLGADIAVDGVLTSIVPPSPFERRVDGDRKLSTIS